MVAYGSATTTWNIFDSINLDSKTQARSVKPITSTITSGPYRKSTTFVVGHSPCFEARPVTLKIEYARSSYINVNIISGGFQFAYDRLKGRLQYELGSAVRILGGPGRSGAFEIYADGELIYSRLGGSRAKIDPDTGAPVWTGAECKALVSKINGHL